MPKQQQQQPTQITDREDQLFVLVEGGRQVKEQDQKVVHLEQVEELVASPLPAPPMSSVHADAVEQVSSGSSSARWSNFGRLRN